MAAAPSAAAATPVVVSTKIEPREKSLRIAPSFLGFSYEYPDGLLKTGYAPLGGMNRVTVGLTRELTRSRSGPPVFRVGGGSADASWWKPDGRTRPFGVRHDLGPIHTEAFGDFSRRTGSPFILGVNFANPDRSLGVEEARELAARMPAGSLQALEIGHEPDLYEQRSLGRNASGAPVYARHRGYRLRHYVGDAGAFITDLRRVTQAPIAGPTAMCWFDWCSSLQMLLASQGGRLGMITYHSYALTACKTHPGAPDYPTVAQLLGDAALRRGGQFRQLAALARRYRLPLRVSEMGSVQCGGAAGVSDAFASALWSVDWLFGLAAGGVSGVNFHGSSPEYAPFVSGYDPARGAYVGAAKPLFYGMLLFSRATANRAGLLLGPTFGARTSRRANVRIWATRDRRRTVRVVALNKDLSRRAIFRIEIPRSTRRGSLVRLRARSVRSTSGVTLAGQRVPTPTTDGRLRGRRRAKGVSARRAVYSFSVPAGSAALLRVPARGQPRRGR